MAIKGTKTRLEVEANLENLSVISSVVSEAMKRINIDAAIIRSVLLAVDEACTNIVFYAYPERKGFIRLACWLNHGDFVVRIEDTGTPFDPCSVSPPELDVGLEERKVGGLGIHFMRRFMDKISYRRDVKTGNQLTMRKHVGTSPQSS